MHYFVGRAIAELALVHAAETATASDDRMQAFWDECFRLRDLLKFDFFFEQREQFRQSIADELRVSIPDWEQQLVGGVEPSVLLDKLHPLHAFGVLRPFVEAYLIVARTLLDDTSTTAVDPKALSKRSLSLGGQWLRQDKIRSEEAVSRHLFQTAIQLVEHRKLTVYAPGVVERRHQLVDQLLDVTRRIDAVEQITYDTYGRSLTTVTW